MEDHTRRFWGFLVARAHHWNAIEPHNDWEMIIAAQKHIEFLEYSNAWKNMLLENIVVRGSTKEHVEAYITESIEIERKLLGV